MSVPQPNVYPQMNKVGNDKRMNVSNMKRSQLRSISNQLHSRSNALIPKALTLTKLSDTKYTCLLRSLARMLTGLVAAGLA